MEADMGLNHLNHHPYYAAAAAAPAIAVSPNFFIGNTMPSPTGPNGGEGGPAPSVNFTNTPAAELAPAKDLKNVTSITKVG
jgi:hypothetical protein